MVECITVMLEVWVLTVWLARQDGVNYMAPPQLFHTMQECTDAVKAMPPLHVVKWWCNSHNLEGFIVGW